MTRAERELTIGEWAVLGVAVERETHGFELARELEPEGAIGRIWSLPRPLVYRAIEMLRERGLLESVGTVASPRGPARTLIRATPDGHDALSRWLREPAQHFRDMRTVLLLKLLLLDRSGADPAALIAAQRAALAPMRAALAEQASEAAGFDRTLARWRWQMIDATLRFLDEVDEPRLPPS